MGVRENIVKSLASILRAEGPYAPGKSGNQGASPLPTDWATSMYAPGWPIRPIQQPNAAEIPREIDYPLQVNATIQPRTGYGLMPFSALNEAYMTIAEIQMCVHLITRGMQGFTPRLVDSSGEVVPNHPYEWITKSPDKRTPWGVWLSRFMQSSLIFDAGSFVIQNDGRGNLSSLDYIDGSTLFVWVDEFGRMPSADPVNIKGKLVVPPAFTQVIKGTPFAWYNQNQIWYRPFARRYNSPYGTSPIEEAWSWVLIIANITGFELAHYRTGNMPEGILTAPDNMTLEQITQFESAFNERMGAGPSERMRVRVLPPGFQYQQTKSPDFPITLYEQARDNISMSFGIPPSEWGKMPGQGLGGAGFSDMMASSLYRNVYGPRKMYVEEAFNNVLHRFGVDDVNLELASTADTTDPSEMQANVLSLFKAGLITLNDALGQLGREPIGTAGDVRVIISGNTIYKFDSDMNAEVVAPAPVSETKAVEEEDKIALGVLSSGDLTTKTVFDMAKNLKYPRTPGNRHFAPKGGFNLEEARRVGNDIGVDWDATDIAEFTDGLNEEIEHINAVGGDVSVVANLVIDHLKENPKYYSQMRDLGKVEVPELLKHCGVCPEDDDYFGAPIQAAAKFSFPNTHHANDVEVVAISPAKLPSRPGIWKPAGGEMEQLQERVGGPMYLREEAAYLLDRSMRAFLVPVAYVSEYNDEEGSVAMYVMGNKRSENVRDYDKNWIELAGCIDYIACQVDRHSGNWLTHPDDEKRPILIDNGLTFPAMDKNDYSPFADAVRSFGELSEDTMMRLKLSKGDVSMWSDIRALVGDSATDLAIARLDNLLADGRIPPLKED